MILQGHLGTTNYVEKAADNAAVGVSFASGATGNLPKFTAQPVSLDITIIFETYAKYEIFRAAVRTAYASGDHDLVVTNPKDNTTSTFKWNWHFDPQPYESTAGDLWSVSIMAAKTL